MNYCARQIKSPDTGSLSASKKQSANEDTAQAKAYCCGTVHVNTR
jgi:methylaspartate ammonia-lyase